MKVLVLLRYEKRNDSKHSKRVPACEFLNFQVPCPKNQLLVGIVPNPYEERRRHMANRKRNIQMKFYVTEEEKRLIDKKMAQLPTRRYGATCGRWRLTDISSTPTPRRSKRLPRNFPPSAGISTRLPSGSTPEVLRIRPQWRRIRGKLDEIWQLQRRILSSQR